jgi:hypothetical protein
MDGREENDWSGAGLFSNQSLGWNKQRNKIRNEAVYYPITD